MYKDNPKLAAERLAAFRGGSMENIQKLIREKLQQAPADADASAVLQDILDTIRKDGGRYLPEGLPPPG
jgi:hypothetical protein